MDVDVVIVGGGPAGCASALSLLAEGISVAIVTAPNQRNKPTETANPHLKPLLQALGADSALAACEPCFGISSEWGTTAPVLQSSILNPFGHSWFIHRSRFDLMLQDITRAAGAIWLLETVLGADFDEHGVSVETTGKPIRVKWIVAANGSPSWAARLTHQTPWKFDSMIGFWACVPSPAIEERFLFVEPSANGWWYVAPDDHNGSIVCFMTDAASARSLRPALIRNWSELFLATKLHDRFDRSSMAEAVHASPSALACLPNKHGMRWTVVGDSAMRLDPLGSSGTATALDSGSRAGRAIAKAIRGDATQLKDYQNWSDGLFKEFVRQRTQQYETEQLKRLGNKFWARRVRVAA